MSAMTPTEEAELLKKLASTESDCHHFICPKGHDNGWCGDKDHHIENWALHSGRNIDHPERGRCITDGCNETSMRIECPPGCIGTAGYPDEFGGFNRNPDDYLLRLRNRSTYRSHDPE